jgi:hypothetical protein
MTEPFYRVTNRYQVIMVSFHGYFADVQLVRKTNVNIGSAELWKMSPEEAKKFIGLDEVTVCSDVFLPGQIKEK